MADVQRLVASESQRAAVVKSGLVDKLDDDSLGCLVDDDAVGPLDRLVGFIGRY